MNELQTIEWLRAYIRRAKAGTPYAPNVKSALMALLDEGRTVQDVCVLTGITQKSLTSFMDQRRRAENDLRRSERGRKADDVASRAAAVADRDARLRLLPTERTVHIDLLGDPPPGRSALDMRLKTYTKS